MRSTKQRKTHRGNKQEKDDDEVVTTCLHLISVDCYMLLGSLHGNDALIMVEKVNRYQKIFITILTMLYYASFEKD